MSHKFKKRNAEILRDDVSGKTKSLSAMEFVKNGRQGDYINPAAIVGRKLDENGARNDNLNKKPVQCLEVHDHGKSRCLSTVAKDTVVSNLPKGRYPIKSASRRGRGDEVRSDNKSNALLSDGHQSRWLSKENTFYRKLTPIECERLQTVTDNYTNHVSNTQRYKMLGNGWTGDVISHILRCLYES